MSRLRVGTAGWSIPRVVREDFPAEGSALERYAGRFTAAEINSSFHRPHRLATWQGWAARVPADFRFAVKLPKTVTHTRRLVDCEPALDAFAAEVAGLGEKRGPLLAQLPPSLAFDAEVAGAFFRLLRTTLGGAVACEPRHASWFTPEADSLLVENGVARVAADPARVPGAELPGGWRGLTYVRLHGSPDVYWSSYSAEAVAQWTALAQASAGESWLIFDNTASGAATANALAAQRLAPSG